MIWSVSMAIATLALMLSANAATNPTSHRPNFVCFIWSSLCIRRLNCLRLGHLHHWSAALLIRDRLSAP